MKTHNSILKTLTSFLIVQGSLKRIYGNKTIKKIENKYTMLKENIQSPVDQGKFSTNYIGGKVFGKCGQNLPRGLEGITNPSVTALVFLVRKKIRFSESNFILFFSSGYRTGKEEHFKIKILVSDYFTIQGIQAYLG